MHPYNLQHRTYAHRPTEVAMTSVCMHTLACSDECNGAMDAACERFVSMIWNRREKITHRENLRDLSTRMSNE
jgi:hypothetical protein